MLPRHERGVVMNSSWKSTFLAVPILALSTLVSDSALAQTFLNEPAIEGVTYREIAEWQGMYGRSSFYGYCPPQYGNPINSMPGFCPPQPSGAYRLQKRATRKGRK